jgi:hypothetical protein
MKPTIGRTVHYVDAGGEHRAAIVTAVGEQDAVSLTVFRPGEQQYVDAVSHLEPAKGGQFSPNTWHWPEREAA